MKLPQKCAAFSKRLVLQVHFFGSSKNKAFQPEVLLPKRQEEQGSAPKNKTLGCPGFIECPKIPYFHHFE